MARLYSCHALRISSFFVTCLMTLHVLWLVSISELCPWCHFNCAFGIILDFLFDSLIYEGGVQIVLQVFDLVRMYYRAWLRLCGRCLTLYVLFTWHGSDRGAGVWRIAYYLQGMVKIVVQVSVSMHYLQDVVKIVVWQVFDRCLA